jgi:hypothetical protein
MCRHQQNSAQLAAIGGGMNSIKFNIVARTLHTGTRIAETLGFHGIAVRLLVWLFALAQRRAASIEGALK